MELTEEDYEKLAGPDSQMNAYYYGFDRTGNPHIDALLSAFATIGKASHSTEAWSEELEDDYGVVKAGSSLIDLVQEVANYSSKKVEELEEENSKLVNMVLEMDLIISEMSRELNEM